MYSHCILIYTYSCPHAHSSLIQVLVLAHTHSTSPTKSEGAVTRLELWMLCCHYTPKSAVPWCKMVTQCYVTSARFLYSMQSIRMHLTELNITITMIFSFCSIRRAVLCKLSWNIEKYLLQNHLLSKQVGYYIVYTDLPVYKFIG